MTDTLKDEIAKAVSNMEGWCTPEKAWALADIIIRDKPRHVVELGVFGGRSLIPMAMACRSINRGTVIGIDPWSVKAALEGMDDPDNIKWWSQTVDLKKIKELCVESIRRHSLEAWCFLIETDNDGVADLFSDGRVGLFHLDANHSEEVAIRHVTAWSRKVGIGGYLVMDDIDWPSQAKAIQLLERNGFRKAGGDDKWGIFQRLFMEKRDMTI